MKRITPTPLYRLQLHRHYDIERAELFEHYTLEERKQVGIFRKRWDWVPVTLTHFNGFDEDIYPVRGDLQWAKRISKEFQIPLPMW